MIKCIHCNNLTPHSICSDCADGLLSKMSRKDLIAHALVGMDAREGKGDLMNRLRNYKSSLDWHP